MCTVAHMQSRSTLHSLYRRKLNYAVSMLQVVMFQQSNSYKTTRISVQHTRVMVYVPMQHATGSCMILLYKKNLILIRYLRVLMLSTFRPILSFNSKCSMCTYPAIPFSELKRDLTSWVNDGLGIQLNTQDFTKNFWCKIVPWVTLGFAGVKSSHELR